MTNGRPPTTPTEAPAEIPSDQEMERGVIGSLFLHHQAFAEAAQYLGAGDFFHAPHPAIWRACAAMADEGGVANIVSLRPALVAGGASEEDANLLQSYATGCMASTADYTLLTYWAQHLEGLAVRRRLIQAAGKVAEAGYDKDDPDDAVARAYQALEEATQRRDGSIYLPIGVPVAEVLEGLDGKDAPALPTGLPDLDRLTGGLRAGDLTVLAARTGHGKTALGVQIARQVTAAGQPVGFATLEMSPVELVERLVAGATGIPVGALHRPEALTHDDVQRIVDDLGVLDGLRLTFLWQVTATLPDIERAARRLAETGECALLIVDYLQLLPPGGGGRRERHLEVGAVALALKRLAQRLRVPVLALAQLNRQVEVRGSHEPTLADLRESGAIEQAADMVWLLWRPELFTDDEADKGLAYLAVAKNRHGATGRVALYFDGKTTRFAPLADQDFTSF